MPKSCPGPVELCFVTHYLDDLVVPTSLLYLIKMNSLYAEYAEYAEYAKCAEYAEYA